MNLAREEDSHAFDVGNLVRRCLPQALDRAEVLEKRGLTRRTEAGDGIEDGAAARPRPAPAVLGDGEAMGLVAQVLQQVERL